MKTTILKTMQSMNQMTWDPIEDAARKSFEEKYEKEENQRMRAELQRLRPLANELVCVKSQLKASEAENKTLKHHRTENIRLRRKFSKISKDFAEKSDKSWTKSKN